MKNHFKPMPPLRKQKLAIVSLPLFMLAACGSGSDKGVGSSQVRSSKQSSSEKNGYVKLYAVNAGGEALTSMNGIEFERDRYFQGGEAHSEQSVIQGTSEQALFTSERRGDFSYRFPLKQGAYDINFYFSETLFGPQYAGNRLFNVKAENKLVLDDFNLLGHTEHDTAHIVRVNNVQVNDGDLDIGFASSKNQASIQAIVIKGKKDSIPSTSPKPFTPSGCPDSPTLAAKDWVIFEGEQLPEVKNNTLALAHGWKIAEVWAARRGAKLEVVVTGNGKAVHYNSAPIFTGFKLVPPGENNNTQQFKLSGVDIYAEVNDGSPKFGLRVIKSDEIEGDKDKSKRTWAENEKGEINLTLSQTCKRYSLTMPSKWKPDDIARKFVLEVKNKWNNSHKLQVRRIVIKGFEPEN
jgi:hypothetical protein